MNGGELSGRCTANQALFLQALDDGHIREGVTLEKLSQWVARIILSLINFPEEFLEDEKALREFLRTFLVPSVVKADL